MRVRLRNYGYYADLLGGALVELDIPGGTLGDLFFAVRSRFGVDLAARPNLRLIIGEKVWHSFPQDLRLEEGAEVALVPVVAGGMAEGGGPEDEVRGGEGKGSRRTSRWRVRDLSSCRGEEKKCTGGYSSRGWCCFCWPRS